MNTQRLLMACSFVFVGLIPAAHAGPCANQIAHAQDEIDSKLKSFAAAGPTGRQSSAATMHRQPTPKSIAAAEAQLGDLPAEKVEAIKAAMARAREADDAGDQAACEQALADARQAFGQ